MKVLIWIGCMILNYIIQSIASALLKFIPVEDNSGALLIGTLNGILAAASIGFCIWLALKLCKKLDWHRATKKAAEEGRSVSEYGRHGLSEEFLTKLEAYCKATPIERVKDQFKVYIKEGKMTKEQSIILLEEFTK